MYGSYGQYGSGYGMYGGGGSPLLPASPSDILQWLNGFNDDGLTVDDRKLPLIVSPEPEVRDTNALQLALGHITQPNCVVSPSAEYEVTFDWSIGTNGQRMGGEVDGSNRMYMLRQSDTVVRCYIGTSSNTLDVTVNATGPTTLKLCGNGDVYKDGVLYGDTGGAGIVSTGGGFYVGAAYSGAGSVVGPSDIVIYESKITDTGTCAHMNYAQGYGDTVLDVGRDTGGSTPINLIILAGQSNATGRPLGYGTLPAALQGDQINYFNGRKPSSVGQYLSPNSSVEWGVEITGVEEITSTNGDRVGVIKISKGSASLDPTSQPDNNWYPDTEGQLYDRLVDSANKTVADLRLRGYEPTIREFWWLQGENDENNTEYETQFNYLRDSLIADTEVSDSTTFVFGKVRKYASNNIVNTQIGNMAAESWGNLVDVYPYALADGTHYDASALQPLGVDFGANYISNSYTPATYYRGDNDGVVTNGTWIQDNWKGWNHLLGFSAQSVSTGTQYIDTGHVFDSGTSVTYRGVLQDTSTGAASQRFGGAGEGSFARFYLIYALNGTFYDAYIGDNSSPVNIQADTLGNTFDVTINGSGEVVVDGVLVGDTGTPVSTNVTGTVGIFALGDGAFPSTMAQGVTEIRQDGVLVMDLHPIANGVVDVLTGDTYTNDGTGTIHLKYIPAISSSIDRFGDSLTNPGGYVHNGSEVSLIQTEADTDVFGGVTIWGGSADGLSPWDKVTLADLQAKLSGEDNTWIKWLELSNGTCVVKEIAQYDVGDVLTSAQDAQNRRYFTQGDCGQGFFSFIVLVDGDGNALVDGDGNILGSFP